MSEVTTVSYQMDRKPFHTSLVSAAPTSTVTTASVQNSTQNKNTTSNQPLTVDELDIEILPIVYEIIRW